MRYAVFSLRSFFRSQLQAPHYFLYLPSSGRRANWQTCEEARNLLRRKGDVNFRKRMGFRPAPRQKQKWTLARRRRAAPPRRWAPHPEASPEAGGATANPQCATPAVYSSFNACRRSRNPGRSSEFRTNSPPFRFGVKSRQAATTKLPIETYWAREKLGAPDRAALGISSL